MRFFQAGLLACCAFVSSCSSSSSSSTPRLVVTNHTTLDAKFVRGISKDDSIAWDDFVATAHPTQATIAPGATSSFDLGAAGHYRWGALEFLPDPKKPGTVSQQVIDQDTFDSDGKTEITLHIVGGPEGDAGPGKDGGGSCQAKGGTCRVDEDCCSTSCGINAEGRCD